MESISSVILRKALDALSMRAAVSAHNIANANSPGFRPLNLTFEDALRKAASVGDRRTVGAMRPQVVYSGDELGGRDFRLDLELATATATSGRYGTLAELLNRQLQIQALAISGSR